MKKITKKIIIILLLIILIVGAVFIVSNTTNINIFKQKEEPLKNAGALSLCRQEDGSYITVEGNCYEE